MLTPLPHHILEMAITSLLLMGSALMGAYGSILDIVLLASFIFIHNWEESQEFFNLFDPAIVNSSVSPLRLFCMLQTWYLRAIWRWFMEWRIPLPQLDLLSQAKETYGKIWNHSW